MGTITEGGADSSDVNVGLRTEGASGRGPNEARELRRGRRLVLPVVGPEQGKSDEHRREG